MSQWGQAKSFFPTSLRVRALVLMIGGGGRFLQRLSTGRRLLFGHYGVWPPTTSYVERYFSWHVWGVTKLTCEGACRHFKDAGCARAEVPKIKYSARIGRFTTRRMGGIKDLFPSRGPGASRPNVSHRSASEPKRRIPSTARSVSSAIDTEFLARSLVKPRYALCIGLPTCWSFSL